MHVSENIHIEVAGGI